MLWWLVWAFLRPCGLTFIFLFAEIEVLNLPQHSCTQSIVTQSMFHETLVLKMSHGQKHQWAYEFCKWEIKLFVCFARLRAVMYIKLNVHCEASGEAKGKIRVRRDSQTYLTPEPFFFPFLGNCFLWEVLSIPQRGGLKYMVILSQWCREFVFSTSFPDLPRPRPLHLHSHISPFSLYDFMDCLRSYFHSIILKQCC